MALNTICIMGRLTADPELRSTQNGTSVTQFTVAVDRDYSKQGEEKQTDFIDCVAWKQTAEFISRYFGKGRMIAVTGRLQTRTYKDKNDVLHKVSEIVVNQASFTGEPKQGGQGNSYQQPTQEPAGDLDYLDPDVISADGVPF